MTSEEAIRRLKEYAQYSYWIWIAIEALSADTVSFETQVESTRQVLDDFAKDRVKVVRCKDCRHWNSETKGCKRNPSVEAWYETDFCSYGERADK